VRLRTGIGALAVLASVSSAAAQPKIPANELPGRERERFLDTPTLQRNRGADVLPLPPVDVRSAERRKCRGKGSRRRRGCR
jgi:hypothetical protein